MFEIYKRHTPMFVTSEVKKIAEVMTHTLGFEPQALREFGIEIAPIFQTVRINENNQFIVRSQQSLEAIRSTPSVKTLRDRQPVLLDGLIKNTVLHLGVDSYLCIGEPTPFPLPKATARSQKPLIVIHTPNAFEIPDSFEADYPALWLGNSLGASMKEMEAFFAISPALKMEVALNRYQFVESFGDFAFGMIRF